MNTTLTVRTDEKMRQALVNRARAEGLTVSELVRRILKEAVSERPLVQRVGHLKGCLELPPPDTDPWRMQLHNRNWRS